MITVGDICGLPVFDRIWPACTCENAFDRVVTGVGTLDHEPFTKNYDLFTPGEFIFTSLGFAGHYPELADEAIMALMERNVSALAIKPVALKEISPRVAQYSQESGVPLFFYEGRYMERIIASAMNLLDADAFDSERTHLIDEILAPSDEQAIRSNFFDIAGVTGATIQCVALSPLSEDEASLRALLRNVVDVLDAYGNRWDDVERTFVCPYRGMVLGFVSFKRPPLKAIAISDADLEKCVATAGHFRCGISQEVTLGEGDIALRQAMAALNTAQKEQVESVRWTTLRLDAFRAAASTDRMYMRASHLVKSLLYDYDEDHESELGTTAQAFAEALGEVKMTAELLFQHPNTVRYRLKKIKEVLAVEHFSDRELAVLLMLTYLS